MDAISQFCSYLCILDFELLLINLFTNFIMQCIMNIRQMRKQHEKEAFVVELHEKC